MVDVPLMHALRARACRAAPRCCSSATSTSCRRSAPARCSRDLLDVAASSRSRASPTVFRQAAESRIVTDAHRINAGEMPRDDAEGRDAATSTSSTPHDAETRRRAIVLTLVRDAIPRPLRPRRRRATCRCSVR